MIIPNMTVFASHLVQKLQKWQRIILIRCRHRKWYLCSRKTYR